MMKSRRDSPYRAVTDDRSCIIPLCYRCAKPPIDLMPLSEERRIEATSRGILVQVPHRKHGLPPVSKLCRRNAVCCHAPGSKLPKHRIAFTRNTAGICMASTICAPSFERKNAFSIARTEPTVVFAHDVRAKSQNSRQRKPSFHENLGKNA